jgi:hypothetical protein
MQYDNKYPAHYHQGKLHFMRLLKSSMSAYALFYKYRKEPCVIGFADKVSVRAFTHARLFIIKTKTSYKAFHLFQQQTGGILAAKVFIDKYNIDEAAKIITERDGIINKEEWHTLREWLIVRSL